MYTTLNTCRWAANTLVLALVIQWTTQVFGLTLGIKKFKNVNGINFHLVEKSFQIVHSPYDYETCGMVPRSRVKITDLRPNCAGY